MDAVKKEMQALGMYKVEFALSAQMTKRTEKGEITRTKHYFKDDDGRVFHNASKEKIKEEFKEVIKKVKKNKIEARIGNEPDIHFEEIETAYVNVARLELLVARTYIPLPKKLQDKKVIINGQNRRDNGHFEQHCFPRQKEKIHWERPVTQ